MAIDPLSAISFGVGGFGEILKALGVFKDPQVQAEEQRREAMRKYMEQNAPTLGTPTAYNRNEYSDVLQPMEQRNRAQQAGLGNKLGLQGLGRSGFGQQAMMTNQNVQNQQMANTETGLAREDQQKKFNQALQKYQMDMEKAKLMASMQG